MPKQRNCGCNGQKSKKKVACRTYSYVTKNPFDVGVAKQLQEDEFLVLLSGNHHSTTDFDDDKLPDWIGMGERPCREYKTIETDELVEMWQLNCKSCDDYCCHRRSFDVCHPNGFINYYLTNGTNRSQVVEIQEASVDTTSDDATLVLKVRVLEKGDDRLDLDGLSARMQRVSLVIDSRIDHTKHCPSKHHHKAHDDRKTEVVYGPAAAPSGPVQFGSTIGPTTTMGPTTTTTDQSKTATTTTTQSTQQTAQQVAQQQQQGEFGGKDDKKDKKHKKDKKDCEKKCKKKKGKKKKECMKKCKKHGKKGGRGEENEQDNETDLDPANYNGADGPQPEVNHFSRKKKSLM